MIYQDIKLRYVLSELIKTSKNIFIICISINITMIFHNIFSIIKPKTMLVLHHTSL